MSQVVTLYVSKDGNDRNDGSAADRALATLEGARDTIRDIRHTDGLPVGGFEVIIAEGTYYRDEAFVLTAKDSGTRESPIRYRGAEGADVRICGGKKITSFEPVTDERILKRLDPGARDNIVQADLRSLGITDYGSVDDGGLELFFNDKPMTVSRWPNEGFVRITGLHGGDPIDVRGTTGDKKGMFMYEGDRPSRWTEEEDLWVHGYWFWDWSDQRHPVESIDSRRHMITVKPPYHRYGYRTGQWFYALNALSEIDIPGEWYLDRSGGMLYFYPPSPVSEGEAVVSVVQSAVEMQDVAYCTLSGMTFEATRGTAILIDGGSDCRIENCVLRNLGTAIEITDGGNHGVANCDIYGIANRGIILKGGDRATLEPAGHFAEGNDIHTYGRWNRMYRAGISLHGVGLRASNNLIHDAPHMAVVFSGNDHIIEYNEIYNVCYESNDAGAIYAGRDWTMRGTRIRHNFLHNITGFENKGCVGIYLDDMFCGTEMSGNLFYRVTRATFIGGGRDCSIKNNIFVDCDPAVHIDNRAMNWASYHVDTTMTERLREMPVESGLWAERYPALVHILADEPAAPKGNSVIRNLSTGGRWNEIQEEAVQYLTIDDNLFDQDPCFVPESRFHRSITGDGFDIRPEDFLLAEKSPAFELGFEPIPVHRIGLRR